MIKSDVYRLSFWFVALLACIGNVVCLACHCVNRVITIPYRGAVFVFMVNLQCADFCMGIYASVIAAADKTFGGQYVYFEDRWTDSVPCKVAGFLFLMSSQVSILIIFFLTLDHLIALCCLHNTCRFSKGSAAAACGMAWFVGILLASIPLLPGLSHVGHYGRTAMCSLAAHGIRDVSEEFRFVFSVLMLNMTVCLTVLVAQVRVSRAIPLHRYLIVKESPAFTSVKLLTKIAALFVACWTAFTATSVFVLAGVSGIEMNVFMAVMVLPLNSAVNPLLCLWHAVTYRQRQKQEERLLNILRSRSKGVLHVTATHG